MNIKLPSVAPAAARPVLALLVLLAVPSPGRCQVVDDFSTGGWTRFESTPGTLTVKPGALHLADSPEAPDWVTAAKVFQVDLDQTPVLALKVAEVPDGGTVKVIRRDSNDKRVAFDIEEPGLYALNLREAFGWRGRAEIETCLYANGDQAEITFASVGYVAALSAAEEREIAARKQRDAAGLSVAPFELVPLFHSCSYYFASPLRPGLAVEFRRKGGENWAAAYPPVYARNDGMYRGSLVRLEEDTAYELRITAGNGLALAQGEFRTWRSEVPVAETVVLDEKTFDGSLRITRSGKPDGWLRYTARDGFVLRSDGSRPLIDLSKARFVILDGLTLRGGLQTAISVRRCEHIRIRNCDIAGWGRKGTQRFDLDGKFYTPEGKPINWDTAILVERSVGTVIERCYVHDPVSTANPWYYSHPAGPQAVGIAKPRSTVLRWNDFIGSDEHRWNDATEGEGNFDADGGFNRDADIHGNFACFANDDAIEIDGGQTNVRVFDNWYEGCLCGVSIQGCMSGPSYVFDNLLVNMGDERGLAGQTIKTSSDRSGPDAVSFIFGNTSHGAARDLGLMDHLQIVARNNLFGGQGNISGREKSPRSDCAYNLQVQASAKSRSEPHGLAGEPGMIDPGAGRYGLREDSPARGRGQALPNFAPDQGGGVDIGAIPFGSGRVPPIRPVPLELDRNQLVFDAAETAAASSSTVTCRLTGSGPASRFRIAQNDAFDWFTVHPADGTLEPGRDQRFTVTLRPERMKARPLYRGAFLVRLPGGWSRPVMVYAATDYRQPVKPGRAGVWTQFMEAEARAGGSAGGVVEDPEASGGRALRLSGPESGTLEYRCTVPAAGTYFLVLRVRSADAASGRQGAIRFGIDSGAQERAKLRAGADWSWCLAARNRSMPLICLHPLKLSAGDHLVKLAPSETVLLDLLALSDNPKVFE